MIKARSLEATLPTINFIHDVYMSLLEQDHQEGADVQLRCVQEHYYVQERYENLTSDVTTPDSLT